MQDPRFSVNNYNPYGMKDIKERKQIEENKILYDVLKVVKKLKKQEN